MRGDVFWPFCFHQGTTKIRKGPCDGLTFEVSQVIRKRLRVLSGRGPATVGKTYAERCEHLDPHITYREKTPNKRQVPVFSRIWMSRVGDH